MNINFCENCDTLLTLTEIDDELKNICKQCGNVTENTNDVLHTQTYRLQSNQVIGKNRHLKFDITLPRSKNITCINSECISHKEPDKNEIAMYTIKQNQELKYICINCNSEWS